MKRFIAVLFLAFGAFELYAFAATNQPTQLGYTALPSGTVAQIQALTSNTTGQIMYCSNCATNGGQGTICISTGIAIASFVLSTGTVCK